jgi:hypothetical protein
VVPAQSFPADVNPAAKVPLPAGLGTLRPLYGPVRGCPQDRRRGRPGARTYSGQRARRKHHVALPWTATRFPSPEPVTRDCVTGSCVQRERFIRPSAAVRGLCVGRIQPSADVGHERSACLLICGNDSHKAQLPGTAEDARPDDSGAGGGPVGSFTDIWRTGSGWCSGGAYYRFLSRTVTHVGRRSPGRGRLRSAGVSAASGNVRLVDDADIAVLTPGGYRPAQRAGTTKRYRSDRSCWVLPSMRVSWDLRL